jgi:hypothetical protein
VLLHQVRKLDQHTLALRRRLARPAAVLERRARRCDGDIHVGAIAARHHAQLAPIDGRQIFELLSGFRPHPLAADEGAAIPARRRLFMPCRHHSPYSQPRSLTSA